MDEPRTAAGRDPCQSREEAGFQRGYQQGRFDERVEAARAEVAEPDRCGVALSCLLAPRHEGRHVSPDGASWAYGLAIAATAGREPMDALRERARREAASLYGVVERMNGNEKPTGGEVYTVARVADWLAALDTPEPGASLAG